MPHPIKRERVITFRPDADTLDAMLRLRERDGVPFSQQIRRALRAWLEERGAVRPAPKSGKRTRR
jgi:hypothetical protein